MGRYFLNILTWFDVGANVILLGGNPHETISDKAALARSKGKRWGCVLCWLLGLVVKNHCDNALKVVTTPMVQEFSDL